MNTSLTSHQEGAIHTLLQFYDPPLRCFTFLDYQLGKTLEEYTEILDLPIKHQESYHLSMGTPCSDQIATTLCLSKSQLETNLGFKGGLSGLPLSYLLNKAYMVSNKEIWRDFNALSASCINGVELFPNLACFIYMNAICVLLLRNPGPTLLGYVYHSVHTRNHKGRGGIVCCCVPHLYMCFKSHLPNKRAFVETRDSMRWSERLMGLTSQDIV